MAKLELRKFHLWLDNDRDNRARTIILQAEKHARKPGFACIALLSAALQVAFTLILNSRLIFTDLSIYTSPFGNDFGQPKGMFVGQAGEDCSRSEILTKT